MENNVEKAISDFIGEPEVQEVKKKSDKTKKIILDEREGLIERIDRVFVTKDGKQLLREWY